MCNPTASLARLTLSELESRLTEWAGHMNAGAHRGLVLIAEFDRREGWGDGGFTSSCAHWLSWKCGLDLGAAREKVRVARALTKLPLISAAMARGELSYSKARALTRVATAATEEDLLMIALHGTAQHVETLVRRYRSALDVAELTREAAQFANRGVRYFYDDDGSLVLNARLPAEAGAVVVKALEAATQDFWRAGALGRGRVSAETSGASQASSPGRDANADRDTVAGAHSDADAALHTLSHRRADALALFAETYLKHNFKALSGGERQQIVIHVDAATLSRSAPGRCEVEDGRSIAAETARRLACDASTVTMEEDGDGEPLNVGRKTRSIPPAIRRALRARDKGCRFPCCDHTRFLDGHHIHHWADGGQTRLSNLVMLCRFHHRALHEGGYRIEVLDDGALRFFDAHGQPVTASAPTRGSAESMFRQNRHDGAHIDPETATTRWAGESMDYGIAVGCLVAQQLGHDADVSAETSGA